MNTLLIKVRQNEDTLLPSSISHSAKIYLSRLDAGYLSELNMPQELGVQSTMRLPDYAVMAISGLPTLLPNSSS